MRFGYMRKANISLEKVPNYLKFYCTDQNSKIKMSESPDRKRISILDENEHTQLKRLLTELHLQCRTCIAILKVTFDDSDIYVSTEPQTTKATAFALKKLLLILDSDINTTIQKLYDIAPFYDFKQIRANGIRSFLSLTTKCCSQLLTYLRKLNTYSISNWSGHTERSIISYVDCFAELQTCLNVLTALPEYADEGSLFPRCEYVDLPEIGSCDHERVTISRENHSVKSQGSNITIEEENTKLAEFYRLEALSDHIKQEHFYGRCLGFYFCPEAQRVLQFLNSLMAGYGNSFLGSKQGIAGIVSTLYWSVSSYLSPEARGRALAKLTRQANVQFCKTFWNWAESRFVTEASNMLLPSMTLAHSFQLEPVTLSVPVDNWDTTNQINSESTNKDNQQGFLSVHPPSSHIGLKSLTLHLFSRRARPGTRWIYSNGTSYTIPRSNSSTDRAQLSPNSFSLLPRSLSWVGPKMTGKEQSETENKSSPQTAASHLLFYIHGGGFIALNSQSQSSVLRTWAEQLDCPVLSIDYSLAPEAPYPRALEECFYAYCWIVLNRERLGAAPDAKIILGGDSAGGNLVLGVCLRAARERLITRPFGALLAYTPILIAFAPSPSRLLSLCDPLLPIGILSKCLLAYAGVNETALDPNPNRVSNSNQLPESRSRRSSDSSNWRRWLVPFWSDSPIEDANHGRNTSRSNSVRSSSAIRFDESMRHTSAPVTMPYLSDATKSLPQTPTSDLENPNLLQSENITNQVNPNSQISHDRVVDFDLDTILKESKFPRRPQTDLNRVREINFPQDAFMSPYLASDQMLRELPPLGIVCSKFDPFLDDCLELAKRVSRIDVPVDIQILNDLPHAFLNFALLGPEFQRANKVCIRVLKKLMDNTLLEDP